MKTQDRRWAANTYGTTWQAVVYVIKEIIEPQILPCINIKKGGRVLECGIGSGKWSAAFALLGYEVFAMDNSPAILHQVHANFPNIHFQYIERDIRDAPLINPPVDLLINEGVIEHFLDDAERKKILTNFYEAVKGYVSIVVPYKSKEEDEISYTPEKLNNELEEVGFSILNNYVICFLSTDLMATRRLIGVNAQKK